MDIITLLLVIGLGILFVRERDRVRELEDVVFTSCEMIDELHDAVFGPCECPSCLKEKGEK